MPSILRVGALLLADDGDSLSLTRTVSCPLKITVSRLVLRCQEALVRVIS